MASALPPDLVETLRNATSLEELVRRETGRNPPSDGDAYEEWLRSFNGDFAPLFTPYPIENHRTNSGPFSFLLEEQRRVGFPSPVNSRPRETPVIAGREPARETSMQSFYPGDLVSWASAPGSHRRGVVWRVVAYHDLVRMEGGMPEETYRITPSNSTGREEFTVGRSKLVRWTSIDHAFEPGDHVVYLPHGARASAEEAQMRRVRDERWIGTVECSYMSNHAPGDIIVKFSARLPMMVSGSDDWNAIRWREDFRLATPAEVSTRRRPSGSGETATQVLERSTPNAQERSLMEQYASFDLASGPDRTGVSLFVREQEALHQQLAGTMGIPRSALDDLAMRAELMKPVAKPPTPTVIGGKRKLKL